MGGGGGSGEGGGNNNYDRKDCKKDSYNHDSWLKHIHFPLCHHFLKHD